MPKIFVKEFSAIATESGTKKLNLIKKQKNQKPYHPSADYYKKFREKIVSILKHKGQLIELKQLAEKMPNDKKGNYSSLAKSFVTWAKGKNISWYEPIRESYLSSKTEIVCNPELNLNIDGVDYVIKLYFSVNDRMTQDRANYICFTMLSAFDDNSYNYAVLDVQTKKMYRFTGNPATFAISVESEIASIERAWIQL
ncbi:TPA: hypothetical protein ACVO3K_004528 [Vibrio diabolicus]